MHKYPSTQDEDEYIELLAEGGYMIGAIEQPEKFERKANEVHGKYIIDGEEPF